MANFSELVPGEKHRVLICCIMGLADSIGFSGFPNSFHTLGYEVDILEWDEVLNSKGKEVSPDIVLTDKNSNHSLVVECKTSKLKKDQIERYNDVKKEDLIDWGISTTDPRQLTHDITLVASYENGGTFLATLRQWGCMFPTLQIGLVRLDKIANAFSRAELNEIFPITIHLDQVPQYLYPVGRESPDHIIMDQILQGLLSKLYANESEEFEIVLKDIVIDIFPHWEVMGTGIREKVIKNFQRVMEVTSKSDIIGKYIEYQQDKIKFKIPNYKNTKAMQAFQRVGADYINKLRKDYTQKRLDYEEWEAKNPEGGE